MNSAQDRLTLFAFLLEESAWLFALFGMIGLMMGGGGSPMGWFAALAIMSSSLLLARLMHMIILPTIFAYLIQMVFGVLVVYLTVGSQVSPTFQGVELGWLGTFFSEDVPEIFPFRAILGSFMGAILWWRGGRIGSAEFLSESLSVSFKVGIVVMAVAAIVDMIHSADLNIFRMMFVFFAASIAGLSIAHLLPASSNATEDRAWARVIGGVVSVVLVLGLLFSILQREFLAVVASPLIFVLNIMATIIFFVIILPIAYIVDFLTRLVFGFLASFGNPEEQPLTLLEGGGFAAQLRNTEQGEESPLAMLILQIGQWTILGVIILIALYVLAKAYQRRARTRREEESAMRESVKEDADAAYDFAKLFLNMIPSRFRRKQKGLRLRLPDGDPNIVDVFRVYFGMLTLAEDKGEPRLADQTPSEYRNTLESIFSTRLVRLATTAFIRACYGHHPASREQIEDMRASLEQEVSEVKKEMSKESGIRGKLGI